MKTYNLIIKIISFMISIHILHLLQPFLFPMLIFHFIQSNLKFSFIISFPITYVLQHFLFPIFSFIWNSNFKIYNKCFSIVPYTQLLICPFTFPFFSSYIKDPSWHFSLSLTNWTHLFSFKLLAMQFFTSIFIDIETFSI